MVRDKWLLPLSFRDMHWEGDWHKKFSYNLQINQVIDTKSKMDNIPVKNITEIRLCDLKEGQAGRIVRIGGHGFLRRRLFEMGLVKGTQVYVEKYAPLKDPLELIVKGYHVSLRVEEASQVIIEEIKQELNDGSEAN